MPESPSEPGWLETPSGERVEIGAACSFGRSAGNTIAIPSGKVSRRHATIHERAPGEYWLTDLGSVNGTWHNDRRLSRPTWLEDGDRIGIGEQIFVFRQPHGPDGRQVTTLSQVTVRSVRQEVCWMLVADIADSTPLSRELAAQEFAALVAGWMERCCKIVETEAGQINRWQGDSLFAIWMESEETPRRVAATLTALTAQFAASGIAGRVVVHHGRAAFGGANSTGEENLLGSEVNFIFRLEKLAARLGESVLVSAPAAALLQPHFPTKLHGDYGLKGFPGRHECWVAPAASTGGRDPGESPISG